jgi:hypothetical protein
MLKRASAPRCLLAALAVSLLLVGAFAVSAQADPYGEIQSFGAGEITTPEKAIGADPETGDVYVVEHDGEFKYRVQDFSISGGQYKSVASAVFTPKDPDRAEGADEIEGVAIDPKLDRLYVLADERRRESPIKPVPDPETEAAGALYAFSTEPEGKKLVPATGTSDTEPGVLVNQETLQPLSLEFGVSLLEPGGIAVDPVNDDVVILATVDRGKLSKPEEEEEPPVFEKEATVAVQAITSAGALGPRYIDSRVEENPTTHQQEEVSFFDECGCASSPAFSSNGNLYVLGDQDEIAEIPLPASAKVPPETVPVTPTYEVDFSPGCELECRFGSKLEPKLFETLTEIPEEKGGQGGNLSIAPEGTVWARARVKNQLEGHADEFEYGGALGFTSEFAEQGWTGGQSLAASGGQCIVDDLVAHVPAIAAGKDGTLFVLVRAETTGRKPEVIEFGPNGGGCPHATATLGAEVGGSPVLEGEPVPIIDSVTLISHLTQANSLGVEWEFGDGTKETISAREEQKVGEPPPPTVEIHHTFTKLGPLTVKEKIHTDDLATPAIEKEFKIDIVGPPKVITEEGEVEGTSVTLKGKVNPNGQEVTECKFEDGTTEEYKSGSAPCTPSPGSREEPVEVSARVSGLADHTLYHFRLVATNKHHETGEGADKTFTTGSASRPVTEAASSIGETAATLNAKVDPEGVQTECKFEYGTSTAYGSHMPCAAAPGSGDSPVAVTAALTGLAADTAYHYRIVAESEGVSSYGEDKTFTTAKSKLKEEEEAEALKRLEEEALAGAQKHQEEEAAAAAAKKHQEEEAAAAAAKKRQEEEAAKKKAEEEAKTKTPTRVQLLAKALKVCAKQSKRKRAKCEATARKKYGSTKKKKKKK